MTINVSKPAINVREKLAELDKPTGIAGEAMLRAETLQEQINLIGAGRRNLIINGDMAIAQRSNGSDTKTDGYYGPDRFRAEFSTTSSQYNVTQDTTGPDGFSTSLKWEVQTAAAAGTSQYAYPETRIEAKDVQRLGYGSSNAKHLTLSFWVKSNKAGTYVVGGYQVDDNRGCTLNYTINSANTWEYKTVTFPPDTTGVIDNDFGIGLHIWWPLQIGSTYTTSTIMLDKWASYNSASFGYGASTDWGDDAGDTWQITGVQLELGKVATPFEHRSYGEELALCKRYFHRIERGTTWTIAAEGTWATGGTFQSAIFFPVQMRVPPTFSYSGTGTWDAVYNASATVPITGGLTLTDNADGRAALLYGTANGGTTPGIGAGGGTRIQTNTAGEYMQFDAEL